MNLEQVGRNWVAAWNSPILKPFRACMRLMACT